MADGRTILEGFGHSRRCARAGIGVGGMRGVVADGEHGLFVWRERGADGECEGFDGEGCAVGFSGEDGEHAWSVLEDEEASNWGGDVRRGREVVRFDMAV